MEWAALILGLIGTGIGVAGAVIEGDEAEKQRKKEEQMLAAQAAEKKRQEDREKNLAGLQTLAEQRFANKERLYKSNFRSDLLKAIQFRQFEKTAPGPAVSTFGGY